MIRQGDKDEARRRQAVFNARSEAPAVAEALNARYDFERVSVEGTTVVYHRNGRTFHLVVHDVTDFEP